MASNFISPCFPHFFPFQMHFLPTFSPSKMQFPSDHSLFTTVQSDDDSWLDAGTKQFFDPAAGGSTHSSPLPYSWSPPLSEADLPYSSPLPCSWSPPLSEADLTCSSPVPCSWSPPLSEAGLPYTSPPPAVDRLPFPVGLPRSSTPFWQQICSTCPASGRSCSVLNHPYLVLPGDTQYSHSSHSSAPTAPTAVLPQLPQLPQLP